MNIADILRFIMAILVGGAYELYQFAALRLWALSKAVMENKRNRGNPQIEQLKSERLAKCRLCPVFFRPLQTCGSPLQLKPLRLLNGRRAGCFCFMPFKAALPFERCWAYDEYLNLTLTSELTEKLAPYMWPEKTELIHARQ